MPVNHRQFSRWDGEVNITGGSRTSDLTGGLWNNGNSSGTGRTSRSKLGDIKHRRNGGFGHYILPKDNNFKILFLNKIIF